jgi:UDP-N-acetylmuramoylalanine--D-glutamate ligase
VGVSSLEIADVAVFLARHGVKPLIGHDLCEADELAERFRAAHIGMPTQQRQRHWEALRAVEMPLRLGADYLSGIDEAEVVVVSQAWRLYPRNDPLHALLSSPVQVLTPVQLYLDIVAERGSDRVQTIGVTGSNGKSTTANIVASLLRDAGIPALLAGNYRYRGPILDELADLERGVVVLELSNHHLLAVERGVDVAVVTNVTANHIEEHGSFEAYVAVKRRIVENQGPQGTAVLNADDPVSSGFQATAPGRVLRFSLTDPTASARLERGELILEDSGERHRLLLASDLKVPGPHNRQNALAAALACAAVGVDPAALGAGLAGFTGVPGRLEHIRRVADVDVYYDIESTTPESTIRALESFPDRPVELILGGDNKGLSYQRLVAFAARRGAHLHLLDGTASRDVAEVARGEDIALSVHATLAEAVAAAYDAAPADAVILLSPAAKAFYNLHIRGRPSFRRLVKRLRAAQRR